MKVPTDLTTDELKAWLKAVCSGVGWCVGMIEIDAGEAAGRPCTLCGESTSNNVSSGLKRPKNVSVDFSYIQDNCTGDFFRLL